MFDLAFDATGRLWASTGGGALVELDPTTGEILGRYGDSITQAIAADPTSGDLYISSGDGVEIFDVQSRTFTHFSDVRVDDLAFSPTGELWGTTWPRRGDVIRFDAQGRAQVMVRLDTPADSIAFGIPERQTRQPALHLQPHNGRFASRGGDRHGGSGHVATGQRRRRWSRQRILRSQSTDAY